MKIKITDKTYNEVMQMPRAKHKKPTKSRAFWRTLMKLVGAGDLKKARFKCEQTGMDKLSAKEPALFLMNHSSFIDLEIVTSLLAKRKYNIVTTSDAFIGKDLLMRLLGCIPTKKFVHDRSIIRDMLHAVKNLGNSIVLYPEASYSFDGTATPLPKTVGQLVKMLEIPVVMIRTYGAFLRDPLYNNLQVRDVDVAAREVYLLSPEEISVLSCDEINEILDACFAFDNFKWQQENNVKIDEPFRADFLNRVLYKCPVCKTEGKMLGKGISITCEACGKVHTLNEYGFLEAPDGEPSFTHIPDWYAWEREEVRRELLDDTYLLDTPVDILMTVDTRKLYRVGEGRLVHTTDGFRLTGCDGALEYEHKPLNSYSLYSDFNWYEVGDVICIGNNDALYYCFPKQKGDIVAKTRLAAEELFKIKSAEREAARLADRRKKCSDAEAP